MAPRKSQSSFDVKSLSKGQLRKLTALRKSLGDEIADRAFAEWLADQPTGSNGSDRNAEVIADAIMELVQQKGIRIPRSGYILRRGRGRVIVEAASADEG